MGGTRRLSRTWHFWHSVSTVVKSLVCTETFATDLVWAVSILWYIDLSRLDFRKCD